MQEPEDVVEYDYYVTNRFGQRLGITRTFESSEDAVAEFNAWINDLTVQAEAEYAEGVRSGARSNWAFSSRVAINRQAPWKVIRARKQVFDTVIEELEAPVYERAVTPVALPSEVFLGWVHGTSGRVIGISPGQHGAFNSIGHYQGQIKCEDCDGCVEVYAKVSQ